MGYKATEWAYSLEMAPATKAVLLALAHRADDKTFECYPGQETLAIMTGASVRTVSRALNDLESEGVIARKRRRRASGLRTSDLCVLNRTYQTESHQTESHMTGGQETERPKSPDTLSEVTGQSGIYIEEEKPEGHPEDHSDSREALESEFEQFWKVYPRRQAKTDALKAYATARKSTDANTILAGAQAYALLSAGGEKSFVKLPAGWLRGKRWEDEEQIPATPAHLTPDTWAAPYRIPPRAIEYNLATCAIHPNYPADPCARCERDALTPEGANF